MPLAINDSMGAPNRLRRAAETTSRKSGTRAALFWAFALVAGLATALMIARYLDKSKGGASVSMTKVVVAATDLPLAARLRVEDLKVIDWPAEHMPPGAATDPKELVGRVLVSRVLAQQPLLAGMLAAKNAGSGLAALIPPNMRAIAVRVDDVVGVAGFIHADDRVDVMVTMRRPTYQGSESTTKVFLQNVKVLAVGQEVETADKARLQATQATVATLLVSPQDAERLVLAQSEGRIMLTLRSWTDSQPVDTNGASASGLVGDAPVAQKDSGAAGSRRAVVDVAARTRAARRRRRRCPRRRRETPSRFCVATDSSSATSTEERSDSEAAPAGRTLGSHSSVRGRAG
jgi:pilus assembly protein CpaB